MTTVMPPKNKLTACSAPPEMPKSAVRASDKRSTIEKFAVMSFSKFCAPKRASIVESRPSTDPTYSGKEAMTPENSVRRGGTKKKIIAKNETIKRRKRKITETMRGIPKLTRRLVRGSREEAITTEVRRIRTKSRIL